MDIFDIIIMILGLIIGLLIGYFIFNNNTYIGPNSNEIKKESNLLEQRKNDPRRAT